MLKKLSILCLGIGLFVSNAFAGTLIVNGSEMKVVKAPHFYEFDTSQNPNQYWWCGQTAFKIALESQGVYKTLEEIHNDFKVANTGLGVYSENNCHGKWCASPVLMEKSIQKYKSQGFPINYSRKVVTSSSQLLATVKAEVAKGNVIVALSNKVYNHSSGMWSVVGHFFTITGYQDGAAKTIFVRDPYKPTPGNNIADVNFNLDTFYNNVQSNGSIVLGIISN